ncbi:MAG: mycothiol transferase [Mycobacteriales bacterium]
MWSFAGEDLSRSPADQALAEADTIDALVADYRAACRRADAVVTACADLNRRSVRVRGDREPPTLRWILVHMVEETGRHAGHADLLREQIDGAVGR